MSDDELERIMGELSLEAKRILVVATEHSIATSGTDDPEDGHNGFEPQFDDPEGPSLRCGVCGARLSL